MLQGIRIVRKEWRNSVVRMSCRVVFSVVVSLLVVGNGRIFCLCR